MSQVYFPEQVFQNILSFCLKDLIKETSKKNKTQFITLFTNVVKQIRQKQSFYGENGEIPPSMVKFYSKPIRSLYLQFGYVSTL